MSKNMERMQSEFQRMLSGAIRDLNDPRILPMTTVSRVEIPKDLKTAKVYISLYEEDENKRQECLKTLKNAQGALASNINRHMRIRRIPEMTFILDTGIEQSVHIASMLDKIEYADEVTDKIVSDIVEKTDEEIVVE